MIGQLGWIWFGLCAAGMILRAWLGEVEGWGAFSALRQGAVWSLLLVCTFFAAVFHRLGKRSENEREHPVTRRRFFAPFCRISPFVGGFVGGLGALVLKKGGDMAVWVAMGTILWAGAVRLVLTPVVFAGEMLLPSSRRHRAARLATAKTLRREAQLARERALAEIEADAQKRLEGWSEVLRPRARELAGMAITGPAALEANRGRIVDIGIEAWQLGGLECMRHLHAMAAAASKEEARDGKSVEFIGPCWEGIGHW